MRQREAVGDEIGDDEQREREGRPDEGVLPSGQVAAVIGSLPSVKDVIEGIATEAEARLASLSNRIPLDKTA